MKFQIGIGDTTSIASSGKFTSLTVSAVPTPTGNAECLHHFQKLINSTMQGHMLKIEHTSKISISDLWATSKLAFI